MARDIFSGPFDPSSFEFRPAPAELPSASEPLQKPTLGEVLPYFPENPSTSQPN